MFKPLYFANQTFILQVGSSPFYVTAFHDGVDGLRLDYIEVMINFVKRIMNLFHKDRDLFKEHLKRVNSKVLFTSGATIRCDIGDEMDDHEFLKLNCS